MTEVPLGRGAWKRLYAGTPEVKLLNRWLEMNPANLREGSSVLARPGTNEILTLDQGAFSGIGAMRGQYSLSGLFNDALFVVCGDQLYKIDQGMTVTNIVGTIAGTGYPELAWAKGAGYEQLWIADGTLLQYYAGTTQANGTLTMSTLITSGADSFEIGGTYYDWNSSVDTNAPDGSASHPFHVNPGSDPMANLVKAIMATGVAGTDYSSVISAPNTEVQATGDTNNPIQVVKFNAIAQGTGGNSITTTVVTGTDIHFGHSTLQNGGLDVLQGCTVPDGQTVISLTQISSYVCLAVTDKQQFYWINPGEVTIDPLNFASKESSPDNIVSLRTVGDQMLVIGSKSTENWYATGDSNAPFAPIEGRVYARGVIAGTTVVVDDAAILVGDDGRVYSIGFQSGDATDAGWGVSRISNNGIEERIRMTIRKEAGLPL